MKKFLALAICLQIISAPVFATKTGNNSFLKKTSENGSSIIKKVITTINGEEIVSNPSRSTRVPVKISIVEPITTKEELFEGQELKFKVLDDVRADDKKIIKKDSIVSATLETVSPNKAFGVPADILVDNFSVNGINNKKIKLEGNINKIGANRSLWVYPVGCVGILFFGAGLLLFPVRGGHAKLKTKDVYEVYYVKE